MTSPQAAAPQGGRFDFDDGGTYCGGWLEGKAHGHGVCTGPKGQGEYSGQWDHGFEVCGVYTWPTGSTYEGEWSAGKRQGLGVETRGRWIYRGEWTEGFKGRYGVRQSVASTAKYNGTWAGGLQDGYGSETYADGGTFQGQWAKGMRHGYGVRSSAPFGLAAHNRRRSLRGSPVPGETPESEDRPEEGRGGFVLRDKTSTGSRSLPDHGKGHSLKALLSKTKRTSYEEELSDRGSDSDATDSSFMVQDENIDGNVIETYMGEWKNDKRSGFGIAERSDGIKYEGEWYNNKKFGYGRTSFKDGTEEKGKYKNNILLTSGRRKHLFLLRSPKFREHIEAAINGAHRASQIALQKADIAISRTATARGKAEQADEIAKQARAESDLARLVAKNYAPEFAQPGTGILKRKFPSSQGSDFGQYHLGEDPSRRSFLPSNPGDPYIQKDSYRQSPEFEDFHLKPEPPTQSAFLDVFRNTSDRRPSTTGFLRRPSAVNLNRRPSTVVELSLRPSQINVDQRQEPFPNRLAVNQYRPSENQYHPSENQYRPSEDQYRPAGDQNRSPPEDRYYPPYNQSREQYQRPTGNQYYPPENRYRSQPPQLSIQQVITDHLGHYYEAKPQQTEEHRNHIKKPAIDLTELSKLYGIPLTGPAMEDDEGAPFIPHRRLTMPTVMDQNCHQVDSGEGMIRTGSLYSATRKIEAASKSGSYVSARKNSLPDISNAAAMESRVLTRETIAILSSQRREAIRRQEEQAERLRANPFLYLVSPEVWDWLSSQQLTILVLVVNVALGFLFFKVIL
ncbi:unnamed protein product [Larinioides sclopetarius]|uniref:Junctophilin n=1 Tax=Larinioides sclopetarius TaxID=280406 RepID=A0AAV2B3R6_9ARAC